MERSLRQPDSRFVHVNGIRLHYLDWGGDGPTCLMLHGTSLCAGSWEPIVARLGGRFRCVGVDLRSHGDSDQSPAPINWELLRDDLTGLYEALDVRDALLVGHSRGAGVGMLSASRMPERFAGAVLIEPSILRVAARSAMDREGPPPEERTAPRRPRGPNLIDLARVRRAVFPSRQAVFDTYKGRGAFKDATDESLWAYVSYGTRVLADGQVELKCPPSVEAEFYSAALSPGQVWESIGRMAFPVMLVYSQSSTRDPSFPGIRQFMEAVRTRFEVVPGTHFTSMEYPDIHASLILRFAEQLAGEGRLRGRVG